MNLPAIFNAANDLAHLSYNRTNVDEIKVIHYLRTDEVDRSSLLSDQQRSAFLNTTYRNPVNQLLQKLAREVFSEEAVLTERNSERGQK